MRGWIWRGRRRGLREVMGLEWMWMGCDDASVCDTYLRLLASIGSGVVMIMAMVLRRDRMERGTPPFGLDMGMHETGGLA